MTDEEIMQVILEADQETVCREVGEAAKEALGDAGKLLLEYLTFFGYETFKGMAYAVLTMKNNPDYSIAIAHDLGSIGDQWVLPRTLRIWNRAQRLAGIEPGETPYPYE